MKKFLTTLAVLTVITTPAFAQSFDPDNGTGNVLSFSRESTARQADKTAVRCSGLHSFGSWTRLDFQFANSPEVTGGGSFGCNEMFRNF